MRYAFSGTNVVKMALGMAAALAAMFALMAATSSPAMATPPASGCAPGVVVICNNPITVNNVNLNVLTENKILNDAEIIIVKDVLNGKCNVISCNITKIDIDLLNTLISTKIIKIVKV